MMECQGEINNKVNTCFSLLSFKVFLQQRNLFEMFVQLIEKALLLIEIQTTNVLASGRRNSNSQTLFFSTDLFISKRVDWTTH